MSTVRTRSPAPNMNDQGYTTGFLTNLLARLGRNLLGNYDLYTEDFDWHGFAWKLCQYQGRTFQPQEAFVLQHYDLEYFIGDFGLSIYNFNAMIQHLDIDPCRFVIVTNHFGSSSQWMQYCQDPANRFTVIETPMTGLLSQGRQQAAAELRLDCQHRMLCLMSTARNHREVLARYFLDKNAIADNLISFRNFSPGAQHIQTSQNQTKHYPGLEFIEPKPWSRINEKWHHSSVLINLEQRYPTLPTIQCATVPQSNLTDTTNNPWYDLIFVDVVAESVYNHPYGYISEKTIRPIICGRPLIIVGAPHTLQYLHALGFKTFGDWWDESYDLETDPNARLEKIFAVLDQVLSWSMLECRNILTDMQQVLAYNKQRYLELTSDVAQD